MVGGNSLWKSMFDNIDSRHQDNFETDRAKRERGERKTTKTTKTTTSMYK